MPTYEISFIFRPMTRPELVAALKRTAETIFEKEGVIRKIENLGTRDLPYRMSSHGRVHTRGSYFIMKFDTPSSTATEVIENYGRDVDIIKRNLFKMMPKPKFECTLADELKPPAYRSDVQKLIKEGKAKMKAPNFKMKHGLDYYPFN